MSSEYEITLSNGTTLATLYPLEYSGPGNLSTPRKIQGVTDGGAGLGEFVLVGDLTLRFVSGFTFDVQSSAGNLNDGTYTVSAGGATFAAGKTTIPVDEAVPDSSLPFGQIQYTNPDANTSLLLPGKGTINFGESLIENMVHITENFAADTPPLGDPLVGQQWYNTTLGNEGFNHWNGVVWTADNDIDAGSLIFRDIESAGDTDIYITASETNLPAGYLGTNEPGMVVWNEANPTAGEPIFRVLEVDGTEALRVEYSGYTVTNNSLEVRGNGIVVNSAAASDARLVLNAPTGQLPSIDFEINNVARGNISGSTGTILINSAGTITLNTASTTRLEIESDGTLNVAGTTNYETLVLADDDIPNKKYVDDAISAVASPVTKYEKATATAAQTVFNTTVSTVATTASVDGDTMLQVFRNGALQEENTSGGAMTTEDFEVTGANQITFNAGLVSGDKVIIYTF